MKRLYVYGQFENKGIGRRLCIALIQEAKRLGYDKMRLDTLNRMKSATGLYMSLGFKEINQYRFNPNPSTKYMELNLR
jgi:ribosomal protein S18 acetylase RimI-like enzyme